MSEKNFEAKRINIRRKNRHSHIGVGYPEIFRLYQGGICCIIVFVFYFQYNLDVRGILFLLSNVCFEI